MLRCVVKGSGENEYVVEASKESDKLFISCTCPAGVNGTYCKHRFALLDGDKRALLSGNGADVEKLGSWLVGSDVEAVILTVRKLESELAVFKRMLTREKKNLARAMGDG